MSRSLYSQSFISPQISINSGQMFLWEQKDNSWYGIYGNNVIKFSASTTNFNSSTRGNKYSSYPEVKGWERKVFRVDDIKKIISSVSKDTLVYKAIRKYPGLRLMRQEPHQCVFSFVCASNTNMFMARKMVKSLCKKFGYRIIFDGKEFYTFPSVTSLNNILRFSE